MSRRPWYNRRPHVRTFAVTVAVWGGIVMGGTGCDDPNSGFPTQDSSEGLLCGARAPVGCPESAPRYGDVAPIFDRRCNTCHVAGDADGPWPFDNYSDIVAWSTLIRNDLLRCSMPPLDSEVAMTERERAAILIWGVCGYPE